MMESERQPTGARLADAGRSVAASAGPRSATNARPLIELANIDKRFGGVRALRDASFSAVRGEILGLCGENGAGKSTLIKVMAGVYPHSSYRGTVTLEGIERQFLRPKDATEAGIAVVHQELMLVPELTVAQNLLLGREPLHFGMLDDAALEATARNDLARFGFADQIDVTKLVGQLGIGLQQIVEIIRALALDARILILDEPTAALTKQESDILLDWLRKLRAEGTTCVYVSHRLDEVFELCDRVAVLRDGQDVGTVSVNESSPDEIVRMMVGRTVTLQRPTPPELDPAVKPALELRDFSVLEEKQPRGTERAQERRAVSSVSLKVAPGEIVALCGAMGSGRTALLSSVFGCAKAGLRGKILLDGNERTIESPRQAIESGIALVPEDRKGTGLVLDMTVAENLSLPSLHSAQVMGRGARLGLVDSTGEDELARKRIEELGIRGTARAVAGTLSGGNQQKVVLGKWLENPPKVLLLDEPTRGVDIGAREEIYVLLERLAARGMAILFASSDLAEVVRLGHRAIVLRQGRIEGELRGDDVTEEKIVHLSTGAAQEVRTSAASNEVVTVLA